MEIDEGSYEHHTMVVNVVAFLPNGRIAVSGGKDKSLIMTDSRDEGGYLQERKYSRKSSIQDCRSTGRVVHRHLRLQQEGCEDVGSE